MDFSNLCGEILEKADFDVSQHGIIKNSALGALPLLELNAKEAHALFRVILYNFPVLILLQVSREKFSLKVPAEGH